MKNNNIKMFLAALVVVLFIGVGVYPTVAVEPITSTNNTTEEEIEPKNYLFQTIIDIANNPDVKNLLKQHSGRILSFNYNDRSLFREILHKKPIFLISALFTRPSMTVDYLDFVYDRGVEITNILGEERTVELLDSTRITNTKFYEELDNIIADDKELSYRMDTLAEINLDTLDWGYPIICAILGVLYNSINALAYFLVDLIYYLDQFFPLFGLLAALLEFPIVFLAIIGFFIYGFGSGIYCWD